MANPTDQPLLSGIEAPDQPPASPPEGPGLHDLMLAWIARSYESMEGWKKRASDVFFSVNGDSNVARNRVASGVRDYFTDTDTPPQAEDVQRWKNDGTEIETVHVSPPKKSEYTSAYVDWLYVADYILLACASDSEQLDKENQKRKGEYGLVLDSYKRRMIVYDARSALRKNPNASNEEIIKLLGRRGPEPVKANIDEARRLERLNVRHAPPQEPAKSLPMARFQALYFPPIKDAEVQQ